MGPARSPAKRRRRRPRRGPTRSTPPACRAISTSTPFQKIHLNAAWFSGRDLDRFSQYQFGLFDDTRIHGVPASGVRYGELAMARGSYSLNVFEQYRLDFFVDQAWGRQTTASRHLGSDSGLRNCREPAGAVEYDSSRRLRQERAARALPPARLDDAADSVAEAAPMMPTLRADLHVHTCHSKVSGTLSFLGSRDCYSKPADVYRVAKARGMDLVAFTDHDSIDGALELLNDRPDLDGRDRRGRGVVPPARRRPRRASRRLRHDRSAASRPAAAARATSSTSSRAFAKPACSSR